MNAQDKRYLFAKTPRYIYKGIIYKLSGLVEKLGYTRYGLKVAINKGYRVNGSLIARANQGE